MVRIRIPRGDKGFASGPVVAIVFGVCLLHYLWATLLFVSPTAANSTPVHVLVTFFGGRYWAAAILVVCALLAHSAPWVKRSWAAVFLIPQLWLLIMSASAGIRAASLGHYADGVARGWPFILGDQAPITVITVLYTFAVFSFFRRKG